MPGRPPNAERQPATIDFFAHQDDARASSRRLILLFVVALGGLLLGVNLLAGWVVAWLEAHTRLGHPGPIHLAVTVGTALIVLVGSWMKIRELALGGPSLAVLLGGREVLPTATSDNERRLRNVVEEMAIAAGIPVPAVFVLESNGINAFAAGHGLNDTAIAVTRGGIDRLSRDELQALVAHETSHLLNGDARINLRLMGVVHGLLAIAHTGKVALDWGFNGNHRQWHTRDDRDNGLNLALILGGLALVAIGGIGWLMSSLVRAGVSRQREFLADAAAVQFTRNGPAVARVLKKTLAPGVGSGFSHPEAGLASHLFFTDPGRPGSWFSTHPTLEDRIRRIDPGWNGSTEVEPEVPQPQPQPQPAAPRTPALPGPEQVDFAGRLLSQLPDPLAVAAGESYTARAVVLATLVGIDAGMARIHATDAALAVIAKRLLPSWRTLDPSMARLPLLHLALPALRRLTPTQADAFLATLDEVARQGDANDRLVVRLVRAHLATVRPPTDFHAMKPLLGEVTTVIAALAWASSGAETAFRAGWGRLLQPGAVPALPADPGIDALGAALDRLARANAAIRRRVVDAAGHAVAADGKVDPREAELLRLVCECLALPLPLFRDA